MQELYFSWCQNHYKRTASFHRLIPHQINSRQPQEVLQSISGQSDVAFQNKRLFKIQIHTKENS